jgi:hypothetical protein
MAAEDLLGRATAVAPPSTQAMIGIWHAPLLVDQGQAQRALRALADPAVVRSERHPFMLPHLHLAAAAARTALGDVAGALAELDAVDEAAAGQRTARFSARANNARAFILRNLGATDAADACNRAAYEISQHQEGMGEPVADALLGLADGRLRAGDLDGAVNLVEREEREAAATRPFAWRHSLRRRLVLARVRLARGEDDAVLAAAHELLGAAEAIPLPRYVVLARMLAATVAPAIPDDIDAELAQVERFAVLEAWWLVEQLAGRHDSSRLRDLAASQRSWASRMAQDCSLPSSLIPPHQPAPVLERAAQGRRPSARVVPSP